MKPIEYSFYPFWHPWSFCPGDGSSIGTYLMVKGHSSTVLESLPMMYAYVLPLEGHSYTKDWADKWVQSYQQAYRLAYWQSRSDNSSLHIVAARWAESVFSFADLKNPVPEEHKIDCRDQYERLCYDSKKPPFVEMNNIFAYVV